MKTYFYILFFSILFIPILCFGNVKPLAAYKVNDEWHFIDSTGKEIFSSKEIYDVLGFAEGFYRITKKEGRKEKYIYLNEKGETVLEPKCDMAMDFSFGRAMVIVNLDENKEFNKFGFIDKAGNTIVPITYNDATSFTEGLAYLMDDRERGYIDTTGKFVFKLETN